MLPSETRPAYCLKAIIGKRVNQIENRLNRVFSNQVSSFGSSEEIREPFGHLAVPRGGIVWIVGERLLLCRLAEDPRPLSLLC